MSKEALLKDLDDAIASVDGHAHEYSSLVKGLRYLDEYRMLIDQKFDEVMALLEACNENREDA